MCSDALAAATETAAVAEDEPVSERPAVAADASDGDALGVGATDASDGSEDETADPLDGWTQFMDDWTTLYGVYRQKEDELEAQAFRCAPPLPLHTLARTRHRR